MKSVTALMILILCHVTTLVTSLRNVLKGKHLRATIGHFIPSSIVERNSTGHVIGFSGDLFQRFDLLSKRLQFTYTLTPAKENAPGFLENGSWHGMIGEIQRNEVDISLGPFALYLERYQAIDYAGCVGGSGSTLLIKYPTAGISNWAVLDPFKLNIWLCWLASFILVVISGYIFIFYFTKFKRFNSYSDLIMYILGSITCQGSYYRTGYRVLGTIAATWCFAAFVFVNVYSGTLTSYLSAQYKSPEINSMEQLAQNPNFQIVTQKGTFPELDLMNSKLKSFKILAARWQKCADCRPVKVEDVGNKVFNGNNVALFVTKSALATIDKDYKETGQCRLTTASVQYSWQHMFYGVAKGSWFTEEINRESLWTHALGTVRTWNPNNRRCFLNYNKQGIAVERFNFPLKIQQLYAAFLILFVGYLIALVQFVRENMTAMS